jgi:hypothetical protein
MRGLGCLFNAMNKFAKMSAAWQAGIPPFFADGPALA